VAGVALMATGCAVTPVKMGSAAILGNQRISITTLGTEVANLTQAAKQYPHVINLTQAEATQATLTWLIRYQIYEELARQNGITVTIAQAQAALAQAETAAKTTLEQQGLTNVTPTLTLVYYGVPPDTSDQLGRSAAIQNEYLRIANGGTLPTSSSAQAAAGAKLNQAECQAAKALNIAVNPQFGQLDYTQYTIVPAPSPVTRAAGPTASASPVATAPAC
jgi:hypothetical protein